MPANHNNNNSDNNPRRPKPNRKESTPIVNVSVNSGINQVVSNDAHDNNTDSNKKDIVINVVNPQNDDSAQVAANGIASTANTIANKSYRVNGGLLIFTLVLAFTSFLQYVSTQSAANIARETLDSSKSYQRQFIASQNKASQKDADSAYAKYKREIAIFKLQKTIDSSQIASFKEAEKEFEIAHSPYMQVEKYAVKDQKTLEINVVNNGTQLAWILENEVEIKADTVNKRFKNPKKMQQWLHVPKKPFNMQTLVAIGKGVGFYVPLDSISKSDMDQCRKGEKCLYIRTLIYYWNPTNKKTMTMEDISMYNILNGQIANLYFTYNKLKKYP